MGKRKRKDGMRGISRIDSKGTHGWYVRVYHDGKTHSKLYSDSKYGGKERALKIAQKAHRLAEERLKGKYGLKKKKPNLVVQTQGSNTGVVGVYRTNRTYESGNTYEYFKIYWRPRPGKVKSKEWSIRKYGEKDAFRRACAYRDKVMREIHGEKYDKARSEMMPPEVRALLDGKDGQSKTDS